MATIVRISFTNRICVDANEKRNGPKYARSQTSFTSMNHIFSAHFYHQLCSPIYCQCRLFSVILARAPPPRGNCAFSCDAKSRKLSYGPLCVPLISNSIRKAQIKFMEIKSLKFFQLTAADCWLHRSIFICASEPTSANNWPMYDFQLLFSACTPSHSTRLFVSFGFLILAGDLSIRHSAFTRCVRYYIIVMRGYCRFPTWTRTVHHFQC